MAAPTTAPIDPAIHKAVVDALRGLLNRFDSFAGAPFDQPADSPWTHARAALAAADEAASRAA